MEKTDSMQKILKKVAVLLPLFAVIVTPIVVSAAVTDIASLTAKINRIIDVMQWGLVAVAGVFGVAAGYMYLTAAGDAVRVGKAKNLLIYTVVAVAIALLAEGIGSLVASLLEEPVPTQPT